MNPKQLKSPFKWEDRRPCIADQVLYVPEYYQKHEEFSFPGWENESVFGREAPLSIEFCTGNGAWIIEKAQAHPERNWIAVELQFERVRKIWSKMHNYGLKNLFIVCGEALTFIKHYVQESTFSSLYVNFPDPWPKEKHAKKRLLAPPFFQELARVAKPDSILTIATDHKDYAFSTIEHLSKMPIWESCYQEPYYVHEYPGYGTSYFDELFRSQGLDIRYMEYCLRKRHDCP